MLDLTLLDTKIFVLPDKIPSKIMCETLFDLILFTVQFCIFHKQCIH